MNAGVYATGLKRWIFAIIKANAIGSGGQSPHSVSKTKTYRISL